jgi:hypothetical protein
VLSDVQAGMEQKRSWCLEQEFIPAMGWVDSVILILLDFGYKGLTGGTVASGCIVLHLRHS